MHRKLIIQIPCYNEESTLAATIADLPDTIPGVDIIETLVIDDGSTDDTVAVARRAGVNHIFSVPRNAGLANAFKVGIEASLQLGADIIVNTDADNQYCGKDIIRLAKPIIEDSVDIVVGARPISQTSEFSLAKKVLQKLGSFVVRVASKTDIPDAPSGFRAFSRQAAMQINVFSKYTYTLETIIQAGQKGMLITHVPITTNPPTRPSRLVRSITGYVFKSTLTIIRIFMTYRPLTFFSIPATLFTVSGLILGTRFLYYHFVTGTGGHIQSVILSALCIGIGFSLFLAALMTDLIAVNRRLLEKVSWQNMRLEDRLRKEEKDEYKQTG